MGVRAFVEAEEAQERNIGTTGALLEICRFAGRDGDGLDSIVGRNRHQHAQRPRPVLRRVGGSGLEEVAELTQVEDAGCER